MTEKYDIKEMMRIVNLAVELGNVIPIMIKQDSLVVRITAVAKLTDEVVSLAKIDVSTLKKEWKDFSPIEKDVMAKSIKEKFDIPDDALEALIEQAIELAIKQIDIAGALIELSAKFKKKD